VNQTEGKLVGLPIRYEIEQIGQMLTYPMMYYRSWKVWLGWCFLIWLCSLQSVRGQSKLITGQVIDASTRQPLPFASVYVDGSLRGTSTNEQGRFQLAVQLNANTEIVASFVGYTTARQTVRREISPPQSLTIALTPTAETLSAVTVKASRDVNWLRQYRLFNQELLGKTIGECRIDNPDAITFTEQAGHLKATASAPLKIVNQGLGYILQYNLEHFDTFQGTTYYGGTTHFVELTAENPRQLKQWQRSRLQAYRGSLRHLLASLIAGTFENEGFLVYVTRPEQPISSDPPLLRNELNRHVVPFSSRQVVQRDNMAGEYWLNSKGPLEVFYTKTTATKSPYRDMPYAYSQLQLPRGQLGMTVDGLVTASKGYMAQGYLQNDRLGTALPADWNPTQAPTVTQPPADKPENEVTDDVALTRLTTAWNNGQQPAAPGVSLHLAKGVYGLGDTLWFSGYVTDFYTHQLVSDAKQPALQIELRDQTNRLVHHQWVKITGGRARGQFVLADSLPSGIYRLQAYTSLDRRYGKPAFERTLRLHQYADSQPVASSTSVADSVMVQFFSEGGHWVCGLPTRLGIKATGRDGRGRTVTGQILSADQQPLAQFQTNPLGMGTLSFIAPLTLASALQVKIQANGVPVSYTLPAPAPAGIALSVDLSPDSSQFRVRIAGSPNTIGRSLYLLVQSRDQVAYQTMVRLSRQQVYYTVPTTRLLPGLANLILLDSLGHVLVERLIWSPIVASPNQLVVQANKSSGASYESVKLILNLIDGTGNPLASNLSIAVTDESLVPPDTISATIETHLLLTGDLRGPVETPNIYTDTNQPERAAWLNALLLTQGWRRSIWPASMIQTADTLYGVVVHGQVTDRRGVPLTKSNGFLTAPEASIFRLFQTDAQGHFVIDRLTFADTVRFLSRMVNQKGQSLSASVIRFLTPGITFESAHNPLPADQQLSIVGWQAARLRQADGLAAYRQRTARQLAEIVVKAPMTTDKRPDYVRRRSLHNQVSKSVVLDIATASQFSDLYTLLAAKLPGINVRFDPEKWAYSVSLQTVLNVPILTTTPGTGQEQSKKTDASTTSQGATTNPLFLIDGVPVADADGRQLLTLAPADIERVELLDGATAGIYGVRASRGVIAFYSRVSQDKKPEFRAVQSYKLYGYQSPREFYVPRSEQTASITHTVSDRRDVLYWKPIAATDSRGSTSFSFPISNEAKRVRLTVQGVTIQGQPVSVSKLLSLPSQ
jgi:hypothetical protein